VAARQRPKQCRPKETPRLETSWSLTPWPASKHGGCEGAPFPIYRMKRATPPSDPKQKPQPEPRAPSGPPTREGQTGCTVLGGTADPLGNARYNVRRPSIGTDPEPGFTGENTADANGRRRRQAEGRRPPRRWSTKRGLGGLAPQEGGEGEVPPVGREGCDRGGQEKGPRPTASPPTARTAPGAG